MSQNIKKNIKKFIFLTGSNGKLGNSILKHLLNKNYNIISAYNKNFEKITPLLKNYKEQIKMFHYEQHKETSNKKLLKFLQTNNIKLLAGINCSVTRPMKKGLDDSIKNWEKSILVNSSATFLFNKYLCNYFKKNNIKGKIVNIGSIYGSIGPDFNLYKNENFIIEPDYFYNKFGMHGLTKFFASKFGKNNINVNMISPGGILGKQSMSFKKKYSKKTFLNRMAIETEFNDLAEFLISDKSSYITGQNLIADGGYTSN